MTTVPQLECAKLPHGTEDSKCGTNRMAKFIIEYSQSEMITLVAYGDILFKLADSDNLTAETFLNAPNFNITHNDYHVITSVSRQ